MKYKQNHEWIQLICIGRPVSIRFGSGESNRGCGRFKVIMCFPNLFDRMFQSWGRPPNPATAGEPQVSTIVYHEVAFGFNPNGVVSECHVG